MPDDAPTWAHRFNSKWVPDLVSECWNWTAATMGAGYGQFSLVKPGVGSRPIQAHRAAYMLYIGQIPTGLTIDHLCRNRLCVNPGHLEAVTQRENLLRGDTIVGLAARKTHCPAGHPLAGDNLLTAHLAVGQRSCRACKNDRQRGKGNVNV